MQPGRTIRCAIYTRKSTEEGLDQDYNSLHAQRDACAAYVLSQAGEGWTLLPEVYDDGGFSGGNMDRPALKRLMAEVEAGRVDVVVVYKVDRLTRSLPDFSRIVDVMDKAGASFVSVTQAFNTTTSMGRLTLNVLLSFAQFEREVTGERIRDKIAASKKKGLWMGGQPILGYDPDGRTLKINPAEAEQVRWMFQRYLKLQSVSRLIPDLADEGIRTKHWVTRKGEEKGGFPVERGGAYHMLRNRLYIGEIPHKDAAYPGQHPAIIDRETFDKVQALLDASRKVRKPGQARPKHSGAPLTGLLFDSAGHVMSPVNAGRKGGATYRYYVSSAIQRGKSGKAGVYGRAPALVIEQAVRDAIVQVAPGASDNDWDTARDLIDRIELHASELVIRLDPSRAEACLPTDQAKLAWTRLPLEDDRPTIRKAFRVSRRGQLAFIGPDGEAAVDAPKIDPALSSALIRAEAWKRQLMSGQAPTIEAIASDEGLNATYAARMLRIAFLAPDLKQAIIDGRTSEALSLELLMKRDLPLAWADQRRLYAAA